MCLHHYYGFDHLGLDEQASVHKVSNYPLGTVGDRRCSHAICEDRHQQTGKWNRVY